jgi:hypothetical protein
VLPETPGTDGTVLYNLEWMREQLLEGKWGGAIVAGVIAHEFGHILQYNTNRMGRLSGMDSTNKFVELHADFLAGIYMAGKDSSIDVKSYADAFFKIGDSYFTSPDHHGTPEERYIALRMGYARRLDRPYEWVGSAADHGEQVLKFYIKGDHR